MPLGSPPSPDCATPAVDRSVLGEWLAGDDDAINELLAVFRDSVRAEQARMHTALALGDLDEYRNAAHRLRGAALSMGARALANTVGALEASGRARDADACAFGMAGLDTQVRLMVAEVPPVAPDP